MPLPSTRREDVLQSLLAFNALWAETGGIRMAIDRPNGKVTQIFDLLTRDIDVTKVAQVIDALLAKADAWKSLLAGAETQAVAADETPGADAIRV